MKAILLFLVVVLAITVEAEIRGRSHKSHAKAARDEAAPEPESDDGGDDDVAEWPQPDSIKSFNANGDLTAHAAVEASRAHGKAGRKSHSH